MDPVTIALIIGIGGSVAGNIVQARQVKKLQEQLKILRKINADLQRDLENCRREQKAHRIWHLRKQFETRQKIKALRKTFACIRSLLESKDQEKINEFLESFNKAA